MDLFATFPVEVRQCILEELTSLRDLQSAIVASRALTTAYYASRSLVRQRVYLKFYLSVTSEWAAANENYRFVLRGDTFRRHVERLSIISPPDGFILRGALWPTFLADAQLTGTVELYAWSSALTEAYRDAGGFEDRARAVELQTWRLIRLTSSFSYELRQWSYAKPAEQCSNDPRLVWLRRMSAACARYGSHLHGREIVRQAWSDLHSDAGWLPVTVAARHVAGHTLLACTADVCSSSGEDGAAERLSRQSTMAEAWEFLRKEGYDRPSIRQTFCIFCFNAVKTLIRRTGKGDAQQLSEIERVWREIPPRSHSFGPWTRLFIEDHPVRLDGLLKVWGRLREVPPADASQFEAHDVDWAREVILELRRQKSKQGSEDGAKRALAFQASVFAVLDPRVHQYHTFGWNLADAYLEAGDVEEAIRVREQVLGNTDPSSGIYKASVLALARLYGKLGRQPTVEQEN